MGLRAGTIQPAAATGATAALLVVAIQKGNELLGENL